MAGEEKPPVMAVPKDVSREELAIAFRVIEALRALRFGSVQLQVHEGRVVQIDVAAKLRLGDAPAGRPPLMANADGGPGQPGPAARARR